MLIFLSRTASALVLNKVLNEFTVASKLILIDKNYWHLLLKTCF